MTGNTEGRAGRNCERPLGRARRPRKERWARVGDNENEVGYFTHRQGAKIVNRRRHSQQRLRHARTGHRIGRVAAVAGEDDDVAGDTSGIKSPP